MLAHTHAQPHGRAPHDWFSPQATPREAMAAALMQVTELSEEKRSLARRPFVHTQARPRGCRGPSLQTCHRATSSMYVRACPRTSNYSSTAPLAHMPVGCAYRTHVPVGTLPTRSAPASSCPLTAASAQGSRHRVVGSPAALRHRPAYGLAHILYVARFAMQAILRVDAQRRSPAGRLIWRIFIYASRAVAGFGARIDWQVDRLRGVWERVCSGDRRRG